VSAAELATLRPLNDCRNQPPAEKSGPSVTRPGFLVKALAFLRGVPSSLALESDAWADRWD
jgi:hypothetical protein